MKRILHMTSIALVISSLCISRGHAVLDDGFAQVNPPYGAAVGEPPTLEWDAGEYNMFLVVMSLPIRGVYWSVYLPWIPVNAFNMEWLPNYSFIWCSITLGEPILWWVWGLNRNNWRSQVIGPSVFFKGRDEGDE